MTMETDRELVEMAAKVSGREGEQVDKDIKVETTPRVIGRSHDQRTQRWFVTCPKCGKGFEPITTRLSTQTFDCPKARCGASLFADYNADPPVVRLMPSNA